MTLEKVYITQSVYASEVCQEFSVEINFNVFGYSQIDNLNSLA